MFVLVEYLGTHNYCTLSPFPEGNVYSDKIDTIAQLAVNKLPTISDNNIGQWLPFPPYPLPNVVLQVQRNIERKVDIIVATLKEGKRGRAFV